MTGGEIKMIKLDQTVTNRFHSGNDVRTPAVASNSNVSGVRILELFLVCYLYHFKAV